LLPQESDLQQIISRLIDWRTVLLSPEARALLANWISTELGKLPDVVVPPEVIEAALARAARDVESMDFKRLSLVEIKNWLTNHIWAELKENPQAKAAEAAVAQVISRIEGAIRDIAKNLKVTDILNGEVRINWETLPLSDPETMIAYPPTPRKRIASVLKADKVGLAVDGTTVEAQGNVSITDPFASARASDFKWNWADGTLSAADVAIRLHPVKASAGRVAMNSEEYQIENLSASFLAGNLHVLAGNLSKLTLTSNSQALLENLRARIFGIPVLYIRKLNIDYSGPERKHRPAKSLIERIRELSFYAQFLKPPSISRSNGQVVYGYANTVTFHNQYQVGLGFRAAKGKLFESNYKLSYNLSKKKGSDPSVLSQATIRDDFTDGFVENVTVRDYRDDIAYYRQPKSTVLASSSFNVPYGFGDGETDLLSTPILVGYEFGGPIQQLGGLFQVRYERIESRRFGNEQRLGGLGSIAIWSSKLMSGLNFYIKLDGSILAPERKTAYGFIRPRADLVARITPWLRISGAYTNTADFGRPFLPIDAALDGSEVHARLDLIFGPTKFSYGNRYSYTSRKWYRSQFYFSQVVGAFEPFIVFDEYLNSLSFGAYFRLDEIVDSFRRRRFVGIDVVPGSGVRQQ